MSRIAQRPESAASAGRASRCRAAAPSARAAGLVDDDVIVRRSSAFASGSAPRRTSSNSTGHVLGIERVGVLHRRAGIELRDRRARRAGRHRRACICFSVVVSNWIRVCFCTSRRSRARAARRPTPRRSRSSRSRSPNRCSSRARERAACRRSFGGFQPMKSSSTTRTAGWRLSAITCAVRPR